MTELKYIHVCCLFFFFWAKRILSIRLLYWDVPLLLLIPESHHFEKHASLIKYVPPRKHETCLGKLLMVCYLYHIALDPDSTEASKSGNCITIEEFWCFRAFHGWFQQSINEIASWFYSYHLQKSNKTLCSLLHLRLNSVLLKYRSSPKQIVLRWKAKERNEKFWIAQQITDSLFQIQTRNMKHKGGGLHHGKG